jgi:hypothetical protein
MAGGDWARAKRDVVNFARWDGAGISGTWLHDAR